jgi:hypothetical protein
MLRFGKILRRRGRLRRGIARRDLHDRHQAAVFNIGTEDSPANARDDSPFNHHNKISQALISLELRLPPQVACKVA